MSKDVYINFRVGKEFKDAVQSVAETNYMSLTSTIVRALEQTYPELQPPTSQEPVRDFNRLQKKNRQ